MTVPKQGTRASHQSLAALLAMSLLAALIGLAVTTVGVSEAGAAVPGAAPANPTVPCTWNWHRWSQPGAFTFPYTDSSYDPTQAVFSQAPSALGANGWYEASSAPQFSYNGLAGGVGPGEATTGANDSEWSYGVGYYVMEPGTRQTITISDSGRQESHAFAFYNSAGNQFDRYPKMADVSRGVHYVASEEEAKSNPALAGGIAKPNAWSTTVTILAPSDGIVYIHYLNYDERIRTQFASFGGACGPATFDDTSVDNTPAQPATVDVAANDSNVNPASVAIVGADPIAGDLVVPGEGRWNVTGAGKVTFTPEQGFVGDPAPIRYNAADAQGKFGRPALVSVDYLPVFSEPDLSFGNPTGETVAIAVTENDSQVNRRTVALSSGDPRRIVEAGRGVWTVDSSGVITYVPEEGVEADPTPISYTVQDVGGNLLPPVAVRVSYAPELQDDESLGNIPGDTVTIDVAENDPTFDIDPTTIAIVGANSGSDLSVTGEGLWSIDPETAEMVFTPEPSFAGDPAPISYTLSDFDGNAAKPAEVVVDYLPVTRDDESLGHPVGGIVTIDVLENDPSNDLDATSVSIDDARYDKATRSLTIPGVGTWSVDPVNGSITITPLPGVRSPEEPVTYTVLDDDGNVSEGAQLVIGRLPLPVARADESDDNELGTSVTIDVLANDPTDNIDPSTVKIIGADLLTGELSIGDEGDWSVDHTTGAITFKPRPRFDENPTPISYIATDELGVETSPAMVTVTYFGVIPESLAFAEPMDIDWFSFAWQAALAFLLLIGSGVLAYAGSRQPAWLKRA